MQRTEQVRRLLAHVSHVEEKKMFGSIGFIVNGKLCVGVGDHIDHIMMVRVGPDKYEEVLKKNGVYPAIMRGREMKGYVFLKEEALKSETDLEYWLRLAVDFNKQLT